MGPSLGGDEQLDVAQGARADREDVVQAALEGVEHDGVELRAAALGQDAAGLGDRVGAPGNDRAT